MRILRHPAQFQRVYAEGKRVATNSVVLIHLGKRVDGPQFGFVASKRLGGAVKRNRAKRLLREAIREKLDRFENRDIWVVLVARSQILENNYDDILEDLEKALVDEGLITDTLS